MLINLYQISITLVIELVAKWRNTFHSFKKAHIKLLGFLITANVSIYELNQIGAYNQLKQVVITYLFYKYRITE